MRPRTDRQTDTQTRVTTIHFASSTTHAKCNNKRQQVNNRGTHSLYVHPGHRGLGARPTKFFKYIIKPVSRHAYRAHVKQKKVSYWDFAG